MSYDPKSAEAEAGRMGEEEAKRFFKEVRGWGIYNVNTERHSAPLLELPDGRIIMPDLEVFIPEKGMRFVEVKWKRGPPIWQKTGTRRHGIDLPNWLHYLLMWEKFRIPLVIAIVEVKEWRTDAAPIAPRLLMRGVDRLSKNLADPYPGPVTADFPCGSAYWQRDVFKDMGLIDGLRLRHIPPTKLNLRPWEGQARDGSMPRPRNEGQGKLKL